jgi:methionyl-tRNA formyltransferase
LRLVFCGTPQFAVPSLKHLLVQPDIELLTVIAQPDRPKGRGQEISYSPVKQAALAAGIPIHQPLRIRDAESQQLLESLAPDVIVIIAYGQIIPARLLTIPRLGWINLHASLLPKYRGAAPINWAIVNGETVSGLTTMRIDAGMDTGDMLLQQEISIGASEAAPELAARMSEAGAPLMLETLRGLASGAIRPQPQDHAQASMAPLLRKEDARIDWQQTAQQIFNRMRGFMPWPGTTTTFRGQSCQLWGQALMAKEVVAGVAAGHPGSIVHVFWEGQPAWMVVCGDATLLRLDTVKLEGRKQISAVEFANGARLASGDHFV